MNKKPYLLITAPLLLLLLCHCIVNIAYAHTYPPLRCTLTLDQQRAMIDFTSQGVSGLSLIHHGATVDVPITIWCPTTVSTPNAMLNLSTSNLTLNNTVYPNQKLSIHLCIGQTGQNKTCLDHANQEIFYNLSNINRATENSDFINYCSHNPHTCQTKNTPLKATLYLKLPKGQIQAAGSYQAQTLFHIQGHFGDDKKSGNRLPFELNQMVTLKAKVIEGCQINHVSNIEFGQANNTTQFADARGNISIICTKNTPFKISLHGEHDINQTWHRMINQNYPDSFIQYQFMTEENHQLWDNNKIYQGVGQNQQIAIIGHVNPQQARVPAGKYQDTVTVTVSY